MKNHFIRHKAEWDPILFADHPRRSEVAKLRPSWVLQKVRGRVHRNHAFEHVAAACTSWSAYADIVYEWEISAYDDSLSFGDMLGQADIELVWYDATIVLSRLGEAAFTHWIVSRLDELRRKSRAPILVCLVGLSPKGLDGVRFRVSNLPGVRIPDFAALLTPVEMYDERLAKASGSRLSERANMRLARMLGCCWLPSLTRPRLKAVFVDLDLTLYRGVLGEDGVSVELTQGHVLLQEHLINLRSSGLFLGMISRNEERDVAELFGKRTDFPLRWNSFDTRQIGWGAKSEAIRRACDELRIAPDAVLYLDDNLGELLEIAAAIPGISLLYAKPDPSLTLSALKHYPGLWSWGKSESDLLRQADLHANQERNRIAARAAADPYAYFRELAPEVSIKVDDPDAAPRLHELSQKTNQFNLSLRRLSEVEVATYMESADAFAIGVSMKDRLSDSGMIAAMFGRRVGDALFVDEWVISCRALGRGLEDYMATRALLAAAKGYPVRRICFVYVKGPRNMPALTWLASFIGRQLPSEAGQMEMPYECLRVSDAPISIQVTHHGKNRD